MKPLHKVKPLQIEKASELGFCFGVRRAIKILQQAASKNQKICTLGPIVHNKRVISELENQGIYVIDDISRATGNAVVLSSHGVPPRLLEQIKAQGLTPIDTTCPNVRHAQEAARKLSQDGFSVIIYGEAAHPEVKGLLGWAGDGAIAMLHPGDLAREKLSDRLGILSQTTQSETPFRDFIKGVMDLTFSELRELRILNTLCNETKKRQAAAMKLAHKNDMVIVVGGLNSANTRNLAEVCTPLVETHHIEDAREIKRSWLRGKRHIGVTAGASTPDAAIEEVISRLRLMQ